MKVWFGANRQLIKGCDRTISRWPLYKICYVHSSAPPKSVWLLILFSLGESSDFDEDDFRSSWVPVESETKEFTFRPIDFLWPLFLKNAWDILVSMRTCRSSKDFRMARKGALFFSASNQIVKPHYLWRAQ